MEIAIRAATAEDSAPIAELVSALGYATTTDQMRTRLESLLRDEGYDTLVACEDARVVGFIGIRVGPLYESDVPYGQVMALAVATDRQRRGVGGRLLRAGESALMARGARISVVAGTPPRGRACVLRKERLRVHRPALQEVVVRRASWRLRGREVGRMPAVTRSPPG
jgi:putative acetyltransferase